MTETTETNIMSESLARFKQYEGDIQPIFDEAEKTAVEIIRDSQPAGREAAIAQAQAVLEEAETKAHEVAKDAQNDLFAIIEKVDEQDSDEVQLLRQLAANIDDTVRNHRPGISFAEQLNKADVDSPGDFSNLKLEAAFQAAVSHLTHNVEKALDAAERKLPPTDDELLVHPHGDTVTIQGQTITVPGGIYTVVFVALAVITIVEVILSEIPIRALVNPLLVGLSIAKVVLVVLYYMHLKDDSRFFAWAMILPLAMAALISFFLLIVDPVVYQ